MKEAEGDWKAESLGRHGVARGVEGSGGFVEKEDRAGERSAVRASGARWDQQNEEGQGRRHDEQERRREESDSGCECGVGLRLGNERSMGAADSEPPTVPEPGSETQSECKAAESDAKSGPRWSEAVLPVSHSLPRTPSCCDRERDRDRDGGGTRDGGVGGMLARASGGGARHGVRKHVAGETEDAGSRSDRALVASDPIDQGPDSERDPRHNSDGHPDSGCRHEMDSDRPATARSECASGDHLHRRDGERMRLRDWKLADSDECARRSTGAEKPVIFLEQEKSGEEAKADRGDECKGARDGRDKESEDGGGLGTEPESAKGGDPGIVTADETEEGGCGKACGRKDGAASMRRVQELKGSEERGFVKIVVVPVVEVERQLRSVLAHITKGEDRLKRVRVRAGGDAPEERRGGEG